MEHTVVNASTHLDESHERQKFSCSLTVLLLWGHCEVLEVHLSSISLSFISEEDVLGLFSHEIPHFKTIITPDGPSELRVLKLQTACVVNKKALLKRARWVWYLTECQIMLTAIFGCWSFFATPNLTWEIHREVHNKLPRTPRHQLIQPQKMQCFQILNTAKKTS